MLGSFACDDCLVKTTKLDEGHSLGHLASMVRSVPRRTLASYSSRIARQPSCTRRAQGKRSTSWKNGAAPRYGPSVR